MLQIVWTQFLAQIAGLACWILLAAAIYALVENHLDRRNESDPRAR